MSKKLLFIVRHGETDYNKSNLLQGRGIDASLNDFGRGQAEDVANYLNQYSVDKLVTSSLKRSIETVQPLALKKKLKAMSDRDLDEMNFGEFEGRDISEVREDLERFQLTWKSGDITKSLPGGESPENVFKRANNAVNKLLTYSENQTIVFILHGRLIRILLSEWLGFGLKNMDQVEHKNGGINQLLYSNGKFEPVYLNKVSHLKE
ncbi:MAG: histidine phosphatase family protein [Balneolaceae bacterium]